MRVYKYRGGDKEIFDRDLNSIERNCFWGSNFSKLNDPCETLILSSQFKSVSKSFSKPFGRNVEKNLDRVHEALDKVISRREEIGIYSLSKTYHDELLWAHYGNSHKGFCIEYDLDLLLETYTVDKIYSFPVKYSTHPPEISFSDLLDKDGISIIKKIAGNKSQRWKYEEEYRIIIDKSGEHLYNYKAVKAIYFGVRMDDLWKEEIMDRLKGRGIEYYQIKQLPGKYQFERERIPDRNGNEITYLCQVPKSEKRKFAVNYKIIEKDFNKNHEKATITIKLELKLDEDELVWIANTIKDNIFWKAKRIFIFYVLEDAKISNGAWATANFERENLNVVINGLTTEQERFLVEGLKKESRKTIGKWMDDSPFVGSSLTLLYEDGEITLETKYPDGSKAIDKLKSTPGSNGVKYENYNGNSHGEYFIVEESGTLKYFSESGLFKELKPFC